jgi:hypothetical protein
MLCRLDTSNLRISTYFFVNNVVYAAYMKLKYCILIENFSSEIVFQEVWSVTN